MKNSDRGQRARRLGAALLLLVLIISMLLAGNRDREVARRQRMAETQPAVPVTIFWLMVVTAAVSVGWSLLTGGFVSQT